MNEKPMKNTNSIPNHQDNDLLPEYDFKGKKGVRGKYYRAMQQGYTVRITNEDGTVTQHFTQYDPEKKVWNDWFIGVYKRKAE